uniref:Uncharacterized protein n=1 Tax=Cacopsylla melanoneura TaxID=428564 RepID=A0A8D8X9L0_9HEMI
MLEELAYQLNFLLLLTTFIDHIRPGRVSSALVNSFKSKSLALSNPFIPGWRDPIQNDFYPLFLFLRPIFSIILTISSFPQRMSNSLLPTELILCMFNSLKLLFRGKSTSLFYFF